jgi:hypothetical protein
LANGIPLECATDTRCPYNSKASIRFRSQNDQHESTPEGQEDADKWADMITMNLYGALMMVTRRQRRQTRPWKNYKSHQGMAFRINSVLRTLDRPAEHFIAVVFGRSNFIEAAFGL